MRTQIFVEGVSGFLRGKRFSFQEGTVLIGTDAGSHVRLDPTWDKSVSGCHATLRWTGVSWELEDHSRDGTYLDGIRLRKRVISEEVTIELGRGGPKLRVGCSALHVGAIGSSPSSKTDSMPLHGAPALLNPEDQGSSPPPVSSTSAASSHAVNRVRPSWAVAIALALGAVIVAVGIVVATRYLPESQAPVSSAAPMGSAPQESSGRKQWSEEWSIVTDMGEQIYPSFLIASATMKESPLDALNDRDFRLGDRRGVVGITIKNPAANTRIRVEIAENEIMRTSIFEGVLPEAGLTYSVYPTVSYRYDALGRIRQTTPLSISASVSLNGESVSQSTKPVRVASINDCPFLMKTSGSGELGEVIPMMWMFAAYVNENHPISDELRKDALKSGLVDNFSGYQGNEEDVSERVYKQVFAIWSTLQHRGVRYSDITTTPSASEVVYSQFVRFIDQSINNTQANCVDGSVLFASILRQIGIEPVLVLVPHHMFVGFYVDRNCTELQYLETTMIGRVESGKDPADSKSLAKARGVYNPQRIRGILEPASQSDLQQQASLESFLAAIKAARSEVAEHFGDREKPSQMQPHRSAKLGAKSASAQVIPVVEARKMGVLPIGYQP